MDAMSLLTKARGAGLAVRTEGDKLVVRGPRSAEKLALQLLDHKAEVMPLLTPQQPAEVGGNASPTLAVRMWSPILGRDLWVVVDGEPPATSPRGSVRRLEQVAPGTLAWVPVTAGAER
jgi:hypothetical protein